MNEPSDEMIEAMAKAIGEVQHGDMDDTIDPNLYLPEARAAYRALKEWETKQEPDAHMPLKDAQTFYADAALLKEAGFESVRELIEELELTRALADNNRTASDGAIYAAVSKMDQAKRTTLSEGQFRALRNFILAAANHQTNFGMAEQTARRAFGLPTEPEPHRSASDDNAIHRHMGLK